MNATADEIDTETQTTREFEIVPGVLDKAIKKIERINRKAERHGLAPYTWTTRRETVPVYDDDYRPPAPFPPVGVDPIDWARGPIVGYADVVILTVEGETPRHNGWEFIATVEDDENSGAITRVAPYAPEDLDLSEFRVRPGDCDHCNKRRARRKTCVVRHTQTGEMKLLGSNCVEPFFGISLYLGFLDDDPMGTMEEEFGFGGAYRVTSVEVEDALRIAVAAQQVYGFVTRTEESYGRGTATSSVVLGYLLGKTKADKKYFEDLAPVARTDAAEARAKLAREWAKSQFTSGSEFGYNISALATGDVVSLKNLGTLVYAVQGYAKSLEKEAAREVALTSEWQGQPKERITRTITIKSKFTVEGFAYNTTDDLVIMVDGDGNLYKWKASGGTALAEGDTATMTAAVKAHEEYTGRNGDMAPVKQTRVLRAKFTDITPAAK